MDRFEDRLENFCKQVQDEMMILRRMSQGVSKTSVSFDKLSTGQLIEASNKISAFRFMVREILPIKERILNDAVLLVVCPVVIRDGELKKLKMENDAINERFQNMFQDKTMISSYDSVQRKS